MKSLNYLNSELISMETLLSEQQHYNLFHINFSFNIHHIFGQNNYLFWENFIMRKNINL